MKTGDRLLALDGLRAVAILLVVVAHTITPRFPGGLGVTLFFFISGFIITRMLLAENFGRDGIRSFYLRRIFRLAPALMIYILIAVLAMAAVGRPIPLGDIFASLFYYANYHSFGVSSDGVRSPLGITWSLAVEEHFYILFPILLLVVRGHTQRLQAVLLAVLVATLLWRLILVGSVPDARIYEGTDTRLDSLAYGCLLSVMFYRAKKFGRTQLLDGLSRPGFMIIGVAALLASLLYRDPVFRESFRYSVQGMAFIPIFCALFWRDSLPAILRRTLESRFMVFIGAVSYSLYLYHFLGASIAAALVDERNEIFRVVLALSLGAAGTLFSYFYIETPMRRFGYQLIRRLDRRDHKPVPLASSKPLPGEK